MQRLFYRCSILNRNATGSWSLIEMTQQSVIYNLKNDNYNNGWTYCQARFFVVLSSCEELNRCSCVE